MCTANNAKYSKVVDPNQAFGRSKVANTIGPAAPQRFLAKKIKGPLAGWIDPGGGMEGRYDPKHDRPAPKAKRKYNAPRHSSQDQDQEKPLGVPQDKQASRTSSLKIGGVK